MTNEKPIKINVAIVGCGKIGAEWDILVTREYSLTHASAFSKNQFCNLVAVCDLDQKKADAAGSYWSCPNVYSDFDLMLKNVQIDLLVVATASGERESIIRKALSKSVRHFVIEKPLAKTYSEAKRILDALSTVEARSVVNFSRRWDPAMDKIRKQLSSGEFGKVQRIVATYGKGILNNGSHLIDLVSFLTSSQPVSVRSLGSPLCSDESSWSPDAEPALDAQVIYVDKSNNFTHLDLIGTNQNAFTCFELKIIGSDLICEILQGGREIKFLKVASDPDYPNYKIPVLSEVVAGNSKQCMENMCSEAVSLFLGDIKSSSCDAKIAIQSVSATEAILLSRKLEGQWVDVSKIFEINTKV